MLGMRCLTTCVKGINDKHAGRCLHLTSRLILHGQKHGAHTDAGQKVVWKYRWDFVPLQ